MKKVGLDWPMANCLAVSWWEGKPGTCCCNQPLNLPCTEPHRWESCCCCCLARWIADLLLQVRAL